MKTAFMYAGQGAQYVGMGTDFYREYSSYQHIMDTIQLDFDFRKMMTEGPEEELQKTQYTQPCMAAFALGVTTILTDAGIYPDAVCGLSIGEYGALYAAGIMSAEDYLDIVAYRGRVMAEAAEGISCSMSAIIGLESQTVEKAVEESLEAGFVTIANYNCPGQYVICGDEQAVKVCEEKCKAYGAKQAIRLKVSGPFHTKYMKSAGEKLRRKLDTIQFHEAKISILLNTTGDYYNGENLKDVLEQQIQNGVHFEDELNRLLKDGYETFVEIGPGKALNGFAKRDAKKLGKKITVYSINNSEDLGKVLSALSNKDS